MKHVVVFFPSWRYFGHFAQPLFEPFGECYELTFLHAEQAVYGWDDCPDLSGRGIKTVDLAVLGTWSFVTALKQLKPDCVVVFDKGWVQDRALLYAARFLQIPSLHIQHGTIATLDKVATKNIVSRAFKECVKIVRTFRVFNATLFQVGIKVWWQSLPFQFQLLLNPNNDYYNFRKETTADRACIIGERDREFFREKEGYSDEQLVPMGALQFEMAYALEPREPERRMLLISQPLFEDHLLEGGLIAKEAHLREIIDAAPLPIAVKPHPREDRQWYLDHFSKDELIVFPMEMDINNAILACSHVVGYFSTALINALILRRPVGIIRWVDDHAYVLELDKDGAALRLDDPTALEQLLDQSPEIMDPCRFAYGGPVHEVLGKTLVELVNMNGRM